MKKSGYLPVWLSVIIFITACHPGKDRRNEDIAKRTCGSCHLFPEPALLPAGIWEQMVLPQMGLRLGVKEAVAGKKLSAVEARLVPSQPLISNEDWQAIKRYYLTNAPGKLKTNDTLPVSGNIGKLFQIRQVNIPGEKSVNISCVRINTKKHELYAADAVNHKIWYIDATGVPTYAYNTGGAVITDMQLLEDTVLETSIGASLNPTTEKNGIVSRRGLYAGTTATVIRSHLYRPVQTLTADLDGDGASELLTCEFGADDGKLSIWKAGKETVLYSMPGAIHTAVADMNHDGRPDIVALFGQGNEQLIWFENKGGLSFTAHTLLRFAPAYGSTSFDIADMDNDGAPDIVYTCGDNADYSPVLKPYHGIYIYHNNGQQSFTLQRFLPQNGVTKVLAGDFDGDGDMDLAAIAYFPDTKASQQDDMRLYLQDKHDFTVLSNHLGNVGRWLVMDAADIDGDGDCDIVLGSYPMMVMAPGGYRSEWKDGPGVVILFNHSK
ncbi:FG-GAP repeat domain-containing protein [Chitinophaga sp. 22321]|uniref:VCBS repeat-containing protein n=1 Tax=Chitinophaga hostae TaxID=2831022 RepID=A0ABS5IXV3_9BACT|nr:VCBS repeat-containing protein [Chitinophaga hostae]MBS0027799.1 VCBS repeat-containing protein [Chitinophaga hostae]